MQRSFSLIGSALIALFPVLSAAQPATTPADAAPDTAAAETEAAPEFLEPLSIAEQELPQGTEEVHSGRGDRNSLSITVYQRGPATLLEEREIGLADGANSLIVTDIPKTIDPASIAVSSDHAVELSASAFTAGDLNEESLLAAHLGESVAIVPPDSTRAREGRLLAFDGRHLILSFGDNIETVPRTPQTRVIFDAAPWHLTGKPALELRLTARRGGVEPVQLSYRSRGLQWRAGYRLHLDPLGDGSLAAYGELTNNTGIDLPAAEITFVAAAIDKPGRAKVLQTWNGDEATEKGDLLGHPTYRTEEGFDLWAGRTHRVHLFDNERLDVAERFRTIGNAAERPDGARGQPVTRHIEWTTAEPLPAGAVYVHRGSPHRPTTALYGAGQIPATPAGGEVALKIGQAFHLTGVRTLVERRSAGDGEEGGATEAAWAIELRNGGDESARVEVIERIPGEWEIVESSHEHYAVDAGHAGWHINLPPGETVTLDYQVRWEES